MKKILLYVCVISVLVASGVGFLNGSENGDKKPAAPGQVFKPTGVPHSTKLNINRWSTWYEDNGEQERNPTTTESGGTYPKGTSEAIYAAGLVWGGHYNDGRSPANRVNGFSYTTGTKPGAILGIRTGVAEDPNAPDVRIFRVRKDYETADLSQDGADLGLSADAVRAQYKKDWLEWPWKKGAPYYDRNKNGIYDPDPSGTYDPTKDEPGVGNADQVIWSVSNDIGQPQRWAGPESGIEVQCTIWGYARNDALGNVIFKKYRLLYKGIASTPANSTIDNMYLCEWSDPDLGDAGDDYVGCDTTLSLGFVYNANAADRKYADYKSVVPAPPAAGYDFLQGPMVRGVAGQDRNKNGVDDASDFAIFDLQRRGPGYINLPMTSFIYFAAGGPYTEPNPTAQGGVQWYQMLKGLPPTPVGPPDPPEAIDPVSRLSSRFWLAGDPVTRTGWVDGIVQPAGDRRLMLNSGPFTMAVGDTQELVCALIGGIGSSNLGSTKVMKFNDRSAQLAYDNLFSLPKAPANPNVSVSTLDGEIILEWESDAASVTNTEVPVFFGGYRFEGYNIYQLSSLTADISTGQRLETFDIANGVTTISQDAYDANSGEVVTLPVRFGTDSGIRRFISIKEDKLRGRPLVNGQEYYFAVTAYNYTPDVVNPLRTLESTPQALACIPELPRPGTRYVYAVGDTVAGVTDVAGLSDAVITPVIFNKTRQNGDTYYVIFDSAATGLKWSLKNVTTGNVILKDITDLSGATEFRNGAGGFSLHVGNPRFPGVKSVTDPSGRNLFYATSGSYAALSSDSTLQGFLGYGSNAFRNYEIRFDGIGSFALRIGGGPARAVRVPFSVWDVGRLPSDNAKKVVAAFRDSNNTQTRWNITRTGLTQFGKLYRVFEPIVITSVPYPAVSDSQEVGNIAPGRVGNLVINASLANNNANCAVWNCFIANLTPGDTLLPAVGTAIRFNKKLEIQKGDIKAFTPVPVITGNVAEAKKEVQNVKVFPNPYYGVNRAETDRVNRFVTFSHLPYYAKLRIFNLAGVLVRTLEKSDATQFLRWNLQNERSLPVASGIYIVYIEMRDAPPGSGSDLGKITVKVAIIQEQQFLRDF